MLSCIMKTSRDLFSREGMNSTEPQGVTYTASDLITFSSPACTAERWLLLPVKPNATFIWNADKYTVSGLPPATQIDCITVSKLACEKAACVPSVRAFEPVPFASAPPEPATVFVVSHTGAPASSRAAVELPATLALLSNRAFSMSNFCSFAIFNV